MQLLFLLVNRSWTRNVESFMDRIECATTDVKDFMDHCNTGFTTKQQPGKDGRLLRSSDLFG